MEKDTISWDFALNGTSALVSVHDEDYTILKVNTALARLLRKTPEEIVGHKCYEVMHGALEPPDRCPLKTALQEGTHQRKERFYTCLGTDMAVVMLPIFAAKGQPLSVLHIATETGQSSLPLPLIPDIRTEVLSERQKEILQLFSSGCTTKEIAHRLNMSTRTVEYHKYHMMKKVSARSFSELIAIVASLSTPEK